MIPFDFFYNAFNNNFLKKLDCNFFYISITEKDGNYVPWLVKNINNPRSENTILFYDQEPLDLRPSHNNLNIVTNYFKFSQTPNRVLVTSEYSTEADLLARNLKSNHAHYFFHGLMCHEWYRPYWFKNIEVNYDFDRTYITYNNLTLDKRLYRMNLVSDLYKSDIIDQGYVSYNPPQIDEIVNSVNSYTVLPSSHKANILDNLETLSKPLRIDVEPRGTLSAEINVPDMQKAFVNIVTETIFYENKVHLTEKIFKPIIAKMPFLLMAGSGNLQYLKRYGFKTFNDYWDESYDDIVNTTNRFDAVMNILKHLCNLPHHELVDMKRDMTNILEHNFNHFYRDMREIVVDEFTSNFGESMLATNIPFDQRDLDNLNRVLKF
jgi:hypothetical protein